MNMKKTFALVIPTLLLLLMSCSANRAIRYDESKAGFDVKKLHATWELVEVKNGTEATPMQAPWTERLTFDAQGFLVTQEMDDMDLDRERYTVDKNIIRVYDIEDNDLEDTFEVVSISDDTLVLKVKESLVDRDFDRDLIRHNSVLTYKRVK